MTKHINTTDAQRAWLETLPTTQAKQLHIGVDQGIVTLSVDTDRRVPIITITLRTTDAQHVIANAYTAVAGSGPVVRIDTQGRALLWVGNVRLPIPSQISGLITHWLADNVPDTRPAQRTIPTCAAEAAKAIGVAA